MPDSVKYVVPPDPRHPMAVFLLGLCVFTSIPTFLNLADPPGSLDTVLGPLAVIIWSALLTLGSLVALIGTFWRHRLTGLLIEQFGMLCASVAAVYYACILFWVVKLDGLQNTGLVLAFGLAAGWRFGQIQWFFNKQKKTQGQVIENGRE